MAFAYKDRVKETTTTTGTGTVTLGGAVTGFRRFQDAFSTSDTMYYVIDGGSGEWEVGLGTLATTTTLARTSVLSSSNSGSAVNFSAGTKNVWCDVPAVAIGPGGSSGQVQYNNAGAFGGVTGITLATGTLSALAVTGGTVTSSTPVLDATQTWNSGGVTFTGWKLNVTDTASASASLLMDLQVGGSSKFAVTKAGNIAVAANSTTTAAITFNNVTPGNEKIVSQANLIAMYSNGSGAFNLTSSAMQVGSNATIGWANGANPVNAASDLFLARDAAGTLAQRNSTNAQTFRWYFSYTDGSNYARGALKTASGYVEVAAETAGTGADDINVRLTPAGTGTVQFGTHSAIAAETVTGYITITDAGGTTRKLAVVS